MAGRSKDPEERRRKLERSIAEGRSQGPGNDSPRAEAFGPRNLVPVTHGAYSARLVNPRAEAKLQAWLGDGDLPEYAKHPAQRWTLRSLARTEVRLELVDELCESMALEDALSELTVTEERERSMGDGAKRRRVRTRKRLPPDEQLRRWEAHALNLRRELGLTPLSRAKLGKDVASTNVDLAKLWAEHDAS